MKNNKYKIKGWEELLEINNKTLDDLISHFECFKNDDVLKNILKKYKSSKKGKEISKLELNKEEIEGIIAVICEMIKEEDFYTKELLFEKNKGGGYIITEFYEYER